MSAGASCFATRHDREDGYVTVALAVNAEVDLLAGALSSTVRTIETFMEDRGDLNAELSRRIDSLASPPNSESECFAVVRPVLYEALAWVVGALLLWIVVVVLV